MPFAFLLTTRGKLAAGAIGVLLTLAIFGGVYLKGRSDKAADVRADSAAAEARADTHKATADGHAALSQVESMAATTILEKDLKNADDAAPVADPSRARLLASCEWMRQQGADDATVSKCRARKTRD